ncbi:hypothetical protein GCM10011505_06400 [Tistrella bauzanensis]|uniref:Uncharacterized protein n=1 Tax=Tistrella bauzanensis TaxID=657419 RepID=A0ABQ1IA76_9PROT|nr:hypothetical protein GCM10011505_06400 [Tistrella bauzanensis]
MSAAGRRIHRDAVDDRLAFPGKLHGERRIHRGIQGAGDGATRRAGEAGCRGRHLDIEGGTRHDPVDETKGQRLGCLHRRGGHCQAPGDPPAHHTRQQPGHTAIRGQADGAMGEDQHRRLVGDDQIGRQHEGQPRTGHRAAQGGHDRTVDLEQRLHHRRRVIQPGTEPGLPLGHRLGKRAAEARHIAAGRKHPTRPAEDDAAHPIIHARGGQDPGERHRHLAGDRATGTRTIEGDTEHAVVQRR